MSREPIRTFEEAMATLPKEPCTRLEAAYLCGQVLLWLVWSMKTPRLHQLRALVHDVLEELMEVEEELKEKEVGDVKEGGGNVTPTRAQNRVRKKYGVGKGELRARMRKLRSLLYTYATQAAYYKVVHWESRRRALRAVDLLSADSVIAAAYRDVEKKDYQGPFSAGEGG